MPELGANFRITCKYCGKSTNMVFVKGFKWRPRDNGYKAGIFVEHVCIGHDSASYIKNHPEIGRAARSKAVLSAGMTTAISKDN